MELGNFKRCIYVITNEESDLNRSHLDVAAAAAAGGADIIQLRHKGAASETLRREAESIAALAQTVGAIFIVNDSMEAALATGADGVHLGQGDIKGITPPSRDEKFIIGLSVTSLAQAEAAAEGEIKIFNRDGQPQSLSVDYLGVGPIFPTPSKKNATPPLGLKLLRRIREIVKVPIIAIGGINADNIKTVLRAGADSIAVISAVSRAEDMRRAVQELKRLATTE